MASLDDSPVVVIETPGPGDRNATGDPQRGPLDLIERLELHRSRRVEVAEPRRVGALVDIDGGDRLGDQKVGIGIALTVAMARGVNRDTVGVDRDVGAVVGVEAADEVLVGFPPPACCETMRPGTWRRMSDTWVRERYLRSSIDRRTDDADSAGARSSISITSA